MVNFERAKEEERGREKEVRRGSQPNQTDITAGTPTVTNLGKLS